MNKYNIKTLIPYLIITPLIIHYFYFLNDSILLGGEGNYFLKFSNYNYNFISTWSHWGLGHNQFFLNGVNLLTLIFSFIDNPKINSFVIYSVLYILPFLLFYHFSKFITKDFFARIISSTFYSFNPFTLSFLNQQNIWNNSIVFLIPLYLIIIFKFFENIYFLIPILAISFFLLNFIGNPPIFVILIIIIDIFIIYKSIDKEVSYLKTIFILIFINISYALANLHILLPFIFTETSIESFYQSANVQGWLLSTSLNLENLLNIFIGIHHYGNVEFNSFSKYYNYPIIKFVLISFSFYTFYAAYKMREKLIIKYLVFIYILFFFLTKGVLSPGGFIYSFLFEYIPFFNIFKTPTEKFAIIIYTIMSIIMLNVFSVKYYNNNFFLKLSIPFVLIIPLYLGFIFSPHFSVNSEVSRVYPDYKKDLDIIDFIDDNYFNSSILHLPGHYNYQSWKKNIGNKYSYSGMDPILHNLTNNNFIDLSLNNDLYSSIINKDYNKFYYLSSIYNLKLIYINNNHFYPFGTILKPLDVNFFVSDENFEIVYNKNGVEIYEIKNIKNNHILRSIESYSKIYVTDF